MTESNCVMKIFAVPLWRLSSKITVSEAAKFLTPSINALPGCWVLLLLDVKGLVACV